MRAKRLSGSPFPMGTSVVPDTEPVLLELTVDVTVGGPGRSSETETGLQAWVPSVAGHAGRCGFSHSVTLVTLCLHLSPGAPNPVLIHSWWGACGLQCSREGLSQVGSGGEAGPLHASPGTRAQPLPGKVLPRAAVSSCHPCGQWDTCGADLGPADLRPGLSLRALP